MIPLVTADESFYDARTVLPAVDDLPAAAGRARMMS
jgi:hypothetical protein